MPTPSSRPVALITGGTTGIGLATARVLHAGGYAVLVTGQNPETLAAAQSALPDDVVVFRADSRSIADAVRVAGELKKRFGKVDLVFLNACISRMIPVEGVDEAIYDDYFNINCSPKAVRSSSTARSAARGRAPLTIQFTALRRGHC
jgi:NAD(P)-dependent dehydrogenase (short-subunit alcohol dehydrogenase family)